MRESDIEDYLIAQVHKAGGVTCKLMWIGRRGAPDRLVLLNGRHPLVEVKAPGKRAAPAQRRQHAVLKRAGFDVRVIDSFMAVDNLVDGK